MVNVQSPHVRYCEPLKRISSGDAGDRVPTLAATPFAESTEKKAVVVALELSFNREPPMEKLLRAFRRMPCRK